MSKESKSIEISSKVLEEIKEYAKNENLSIKEATQKLIKKGLEELAPTQCYICKQAVEATESIKCSNCGNKIHCGYLRIDYSSRWKGETWSEDPRISCYSCLIEQFFDSEEISTLEEMKEKIEELIDDLVREFGRDTGGTTTEAIIHNSERNEPYTWEYLEEEFSDYFKDIEDNGE